MSLLQIIRVDDRKRDVGETNYLIQLERIIVKIDLNFYPSYLKSCNHPKEFGVI